MSPNLTGGGERRSGDDITTTPPPFFVTFCHERNVLKKVDWSANQARPPWDRPAINMVGGVAPEATVMVRTRTHTRAPSLNLEL